MIDKTQRKDNTFRAPINRQIRASEVLLLDGEENLGKVALHVAIKMAEDKGLDLVQFTKSDPGTTPTCKILNYGKFKFEQSKKQKAAEKKQRDAEVKTKEIKFRPDTADNDLRIKADHARSFLQDGCKVRISIMFRGREHTLQAQARKTLGVFLEFLQETADGPAGKIVTNPQMEGSAMSFLIEPLK